MRHKSSKRQVHSQPWVRRVSGNFLLILSVMLLHGVLAHTYAQRPTQSPQPAPTPKRPAMPNVVGMNEKVATVLLLFYGKRITKQTGPSSRPKGIVYEQSPKAGTPSDQIKGIILFVSAGAAPSPSPTVAPTQTATPAGTQTPAPTRTMTPVPTRTPPPNNSNQATNTGVETTPTGRPTPTTTPATSPDQSPAIQSEQESNGNANSQANTAQNQNTAGQTEETKPSPLPSVSFNESKFPWPWIALAVIAIVLLLVIGTVATLRKVRMRKWERLINITPSLDPNEIDIASISPLDFQVPPIAVGARLEWGDSLLTPIEIGEKGK